MDTVDVGTIKTNKKTNKIVSLIDAVSLRPIQKGAAKDIITKYHYSHILGPCTYCLGVYYKEDNEHFDDDGKLIGCLTYGRPLARLGVKSISEKLEARQTLELTRLFIHDGYPKNIESRSIALSFEWIRQNLPEIEVLISYSDPEQGHRGIIYQATNWSYQGTGFSLMSKFGVSLTKDPYNWCHHRTVYDTYGTSSLEILKEKIGQTFWIKMTPNKHRYIYLLRNRKYWKKNLKYPILPYPKDSTKQEELIKEVTIC